MRDWRLARLMFLMVAACGFSLPARGEVIVDHQPHQFGGLASDTRYRLSPGGVARWQQVADDFTLASSNSVVSLVFWGFYNADNPPLFETMRIRFYGARPGDGLPSEADLISESTIQDPVRVATGRIIVQGIGPREFRYEASLSHPVFLEAQRKYWLEIVQLGDIETLFRWEDSVNAEFNGSAYINPGVNDWQASWPNGPADTAFQLITPEPCSLALLGFAFLFAPPKWRRRRKEDAGGIDIRSAL